MKIHVFSMLCVLMFGCNFAPPPRPEPGNTAVPSVKGMLLARVNDWAIGTRDFEDMLNTLKDSPQLGENISEAETQKKILQEIVNQQILAEEAKRRGMHEMSDIRQQVDAYESTLLAQRFIEELQADIVVTPIEIETFYRANSMLFAEPERRKVREIVVRSQSKAQDIMMDLWKGSNFATQARLNSVAETRGRGGDLGYVVMDENTLREKKFEKYWQEVMSKKEGEMSNVFRGDDGNYYIILVEDIREGKEKPLSEVRDTIRTHLTQRKLLKRRDDLIHEAKQKMDVEINAELLD
ncbi:MAG: hypothetical protein GF333_04690 [Candidatus Omnitrophica bacterium]|nr:hypothetical protein [Candidatus Omnitrophota bacterium]